MKKLIKKYIKKDDPQTLHKLRIKARATLVKLAKEGKTDKGLKRLLRKSSKLRDNDVLIRICKKRKIIKYIKKRHKKLHKIRIEVKKCRYTNLEYEKILKKIQNFLGKAHDFYNCEKLMKKFGFNYLKIKKKKEKFIKKAEKKRIEFLNQISTLQSSL